MSWWRLHLMQLGFTFDQMLEMRNDDCFELIRLDTFLNTGSEPAR